MTYLNLVIVEGNLTYDAEVRHISQETFVTSFTIANNEYFKNTKNETISKANFIRVEVWGEVFANKLSPYLKKGTALRVSGKLRSDSWNTEDGSKRERVYIRASSIDFIKYNQNIDKTSEKDKNNIEIDDIEIIDSIDNKLFEDYDNALPENSTDGTVNKNKIRNKK